MSTSNYYLKRIGETSSLFKLSELEQNAILKDIFESTLQLWKSLILLDISDILECVPNISKIGGIDEAAEYAKGYDKEGLILSKIVTSLLDNAEIKSEYRRISHLKNSIVTRNQKLVVSLLQRFKNSLLRDLKLDLTDIIQEGNIGLIKAVERFDYRRGCQFSTYATFWIKQSVLNSAYSFSNKMVSSLDTDTNYISLRSCGITYDMLMDRLGTPMNIDSLGNPYWGESGDSIFLGEVVNFLNDRHVVSQLESRDVLNKALNKIGDDYCDAIQRSLSGQEVEDKLLKKAVRSLRVALGDLVRDS